MKRLLGLLLALTCIALLPASDGIVTRDAVVDRASPALTLKDLDGRKVSFESSKGKVVVVDFWATWCEPCKTEIPALEAIARRHPGRVEVIGVSADDEVDGVSQFARDLGTTFSIG